MRPNENSGDKTRIFPGERIWSGGGTAKKGGKGRIMKGLGVGVPGTQYGTQELGIGNQGSGIRLRGEASMLGGWEARKKKRLASVLASRRPSILASSSRLTGI